MKSNCFIWAIKQFFRHGGYIAFRRGKRFRGVYLHFFWAKQIMGPWMSYCSKTKKVYPWPMFDGEVKEGDDTTQ